MFLRNWYTLFKICCYGRSKNAKSVVDTSGTKFAVYNDGFTYSDRNEPRYSPTAPTSCFPQSNHSTTNGAIRGSTLDGYDSPENTAAVFFGSGIRPVSLDDYCLESVHTNSISISDDIGVTRSISDSENSVTVEYSYLIENVSDEDILIAEIGLCVPMNSFSSPYTYNHPVLIDRTLLTEPVTITPGNTEVVTYTITYNLPSPE